MIPDKLLDEEALATTLAQYDVYYLRTATTADPLPLEPGELIAALAQHSSPRLHEALIPLFLRHPEFAEFVPELVENLPPTASEMLSHLYTAAVYLQRLWRGQLNMYLGSSLLLPDYFGESEWELPAPTEHYGEAGLRVLAEKLRAKTGFNWLSAYESIISLFLYQLRLKVNG
jgi:hypothetical protein